MRTLALLIGLTLLASCADSSPNYKAYLEAVKHHDTQQAQQATSTISGIQQTRPQRGFETQAEAVMFSVIQAMLIERVKYTAFSVGAPLTGYDLLSRVTVPILQLVNPWLLWAVAGNDSVTNKSGNPTYVAYGDGDILVHSANAGAYNTESVLEMNGQTTNFKTEDVCLTCDENGEVVNPLPGDPGYECSAGEMITPNCSCLTRQAGRC